MVVIYDVPSDQLHELKWGKFRDRNYMTQFNQPTEEEMNVLSRLLLSDENGVKIANILLNLMSDPEKRRGLLARLIEIQKESNKKIQGRAVGSQRAILDMINELGPLSTDQVMENSADYGYRSLRFKQHASTTLNKAVNQGYIGKVRSKNGLKFASPKDAIQEALKDMDGKLPIECGPDDLLEISKKTDLQIEVIDNVLRNWNS